MFDRHFWQTWWKCLEHGTAGKAFDDWRTTFLDTVRSRILRISQTRHSRFWCCKYLYWGNLNYWKLNLVVFSVPLLLKPLGARWLTSTKTALWAVQLMDLYNSGIWCANRRCDCWCQGAILHVALQDRCVKNMVCLKIGDLIPWFIIISQVKYAIRCNKSGNARFWTNQNHRCFTWTFTKQWTWSLTENALVHCVAEWPHGQGAKLVPDVLRTLSPCLFQRSWICSDSDSDYKDIICYNYNLHIYIYHVVYRLVSWDYCGKKTKIIEYLVNGGVGLYCEKFFLRSNFFGRSFIHLYTPFFG